MAKIKLVKDVLGDRHKKLTTRELRENLAEALEFTSSDEGKLVLTKNGQNRAALVSIRDLMMLDALEDLRVKELLWGKFDKEIFWSALKERLSSDGDSSNELSLEETKKGHARRRRKVSS